MPVPAVIDVSLKGGSSSQHSVLREAPRRCHTNSPLTGFVSSALLLTNCGLKTSRVVFPGRIWNGSTIAESALVVVIFALGIPASPLLRRQAVAPTFGHRL